MATHQMTLGYITPGVQDNGGYLSATPIYQTLVFDEWKENQPQPTYEQFSGLGCPSIPTARTIFIAHLGHPHYHLRKPLPVVLESDPPHEVAYSHDLDVMGWGATDGEALADFRAALCELYGSLREDPGNLGPHLQSVLRFLEQEVIEEA